MYWSARAQADGGFVQLIWPAVVLSERFFSVAVKFGAAVAVMKWTLSTWNVAGTLLAKKTPGCCTLVRFTDVIPIRIRVHWFFMVAGSQPRSLRVVRITTPKGPLEF